MGNVVEIDYRSAMGCVRRKVVRGNVRTMIGVSPTTSAPSTMTPQTSFSSLKKKNVHTFRLITDRFVKNLKGFNQSNASKNQN